jgi:hypothetical protein
MRCGSRVRIYLGSAQIRAIGGAGEFGGGVGVCASAPLWHKDDGCARFACPCPSLQLGISHYNVSVTIGMYAAYPQAVDHAGGKVSCTVQNML